MNKEHTQKIRTEEFVEFRDRAAYPKGLRGLLKWFYDCIKWNWAGIAYCGHCEVDTKWEVWAVGLTPDSPVGYMLECQTCKTTYFVKDLGQIMTGLYIKEIAPPASSLSQPPSLDS